MRVPPSILLPLALMACSSDVVDAEWDLDSRDVPDLGTSDGVAPVDLASAADVSLDADATAPQPIPLPDSIACEFSPETIEYPPSDWVFEQPEWDEELGGPWTVGTFRDGFVRDQVAYGLSPSLRHTTDRYVSTLWLVPGDDVELHLAIQTLEEDWQGSGFSVTVLLDWEPVESARHIQWSPQREEIKAEATGTGTVFRMNSATEIFDAIVPAENFPEERMYELAIVVRPYGMTNPALHRRFTVFAGGAERKPHPCVPDGDALDLDEVLPDEYFSYLAGRRLGLLYPAGIAWDDLPGEKSATSGETLAYDWFVTDYVNERNMALVPIVNGQPVEPVQFRRIDRRGGLNVAIGHHDSFETTLDDPTSVVFVAQWRDPYYPAFAPQGVPVAFPPSDAYGNAGVRVAATTVFSGTNVLLYRVE